MKNINIFKQLLFLIVFLSGVNLQAQNITNPGFEIKDACPSTYAIPTAHTIQFATGWSQPTNATTDYLNTCGYVGWLPMAPASGEGFAGAFAEAAEQSVEDGFSADYKEYLTTQLSSPLVAGVTYTISFNVAHLYQLTADANGYIFKDLPAAEKGKLGLVFSTSSPTTSNTVPPIGQAASPPATTSISNSFGAGRVMIPASNTNVYGAPSRNIWVPVTLQYTAVGGETFMTVGQFRPGNTALVNDPFAGTYEVAYYLYDGFSMSGPPNAILGKTLSPTSISVGGTATYTFTIANTVAGNVAQSGLSFTDNLPSGLRIAANPNVVVSGLTGGTVSATAGGTSIGVAGYNIAANTTATITVDVTNAPGQSNANCTANPAAFTNKATNITAISSNLTNNVSATGVCLQVIPCGAGNTAPVINN